MRTSLRSSCPVQVPLPVAMRAHCLHALAADLASEPPAEPVPAVPHRLVTDFDAVFMLQVLDVSEREGSWM